METAKFEFYIPVGLESTEETKKVKELLDKIKSLYSVAILEKVINPVEEEELKSKFLWSLSVAKRIGIHQTAKTKSLYPQLVIFDKEEPITFYPQSYGKKSITIENFLKGLLERRVECIHDKYELEKFINKSLIGDVK